MLLTKLSTEDHLRKLVDDKKISHHSPGLWPDRKCIRRLWLHPVVRSFSENPDAGTTYGAKVRAIFSAFVAGEDFDDDDLLKNLSKGPDGNIGIHEIKILWFPKARVLGGFLRHGEFVALSHADRDLLATFGFQPIINLVKERWKELFPEREMLNDSRSELLRKFDGAV